MSIKPQPEMCEQCGKEKSVVGLGKRWLCMSCFEGRLKKARAFAEETAKMLPGR